MKAVSIGIFILVSSLRTGDNNQADGIMEALANASVKAITFKHQKFEKSEQIISQLDNSDNNINIIIGVGRLGIDEMLKLQSRKLDGETLYLWSGHQAMPKILELSPDTIIALPEYAINTKLTARFKNIVPIIGVAHNTTIEKIITSFKSNPETSNIDKAITLVILPGDAADINGEQRLYTDQDVTRLVDFIKGYIERGAIPKKVIVTNGPRTGKHDKKTKAVLNVHGRNLTDISKKIALDYVTSACSEQFKQANIDFAVYNFDFRFLPSAYYSLYD